MKRSTWRPHRDGFLCLLSLFFSWFVFACSFFTLNLVGRILGRYFNRLCFWRCCRCFWNCYLLLEQRASAGTFDHLSLRLPRLCLAACFLCTRFSTHFSDVNFPGLLFVQGTFAFYLNSLKFRNVLKQTENCRISFACNQNIKEDIPTAFEVFLCF